MTSLHPHSLSKGLNFLLETDYRSILPKLQTPCAIIHGTADTICPVDAAHYLAENLPNAGLYLFPGAGHIPFYTQPDTFTTLLKECDKQ